MTALDRVSIDAAAALAMRRRSTALRLLLMGLIGLMLAVIGRWPLAPLWWAAYAGLQLVLQHLEQRGSRADATRLYLASFASFAVAGAPAWHMWTQMGAVGPPAATMFLCGMLAQLVASSLGARALFLASATPLVGYLMIVPTLAFGPRRPVEALGILACAVILVTYLFVLWRGQQRVLESVEDSREQAEHANRAKTEFLATMSHEIRTPMNAVLGAGDLLARTELSEEQRGHVAMLSDAGAVLMQLLNDVLDLSKIEAGKLEIDPAPTDVQALIRRCANLWRPRAMDAGLELQVEIDPQLPPCLVVDGMRTGQIVFNLLSNAVKFTPSGRVTLAVGFDRRPDGGGEMVLSVADTGVGIAPEALQRIFSPFEQADSSITRRFGGTGLGLAISRRLAEMMGGGLTARSVEGQGATFILRLPAEAARAAAPELAATGDSAARPAPAGLRVLVAEDNPANQRIIEHFLRPLDVQLTLVDDGAKAVEVARAQAFDVVLMDMQMPVMDGLEAARRIRAGGGPNAQTPIFALTANVMDSHREACRAAGMSGHIAKPIDARILLSTVLAAAGLRQPAEDPLPSAA